MLEIQRGLDVAVVGVFRSDDAQRLLHVVTPEEVADAAFEQKSLGDGPASDRVNLLAEVRAVAGIDAEASAASGGCSEGVARNAGDVVPVVVGVLEILLVNIEGTPKGSRVDR
jgi:hypothetical protein